MCHGYIKLLAEHSCRLRPQERKKAVIMSFIESLRLRGSKSALTPDSLRRLSPNPGQTVGIIIAALLGTIVSVVLILWILFRYRNWRLKRRRARRRRTTSAAKTETVLSTADKENLSKRPKEAGGGPGGKNAEKAASDTLDINPDEGENTAVSRCTKKETEEEKSSLAKIEGLGVHVCSNAGSSPSSPGVSALDHSTKSGLSESQSKKPEGSANDKVTLLPLIHAPEKDEYGRRCSAPPPRSAPFPYDVILNQGEEEPKNSRVFQEHQRRQSAPPNCDYYAYFARQPNSKKPHVILHSHSGSKTPAIRHFNKRYDSPTNNSATRPTTRTPPLTVQGRNVATMASLTAKVGTSSRSESLPKNRTHYTKLIMNSSAEPGAGVQLPEQPPSLQGS